MESAPVAHGRAGPVNPRAEGGFALPTVLMLMIAAFALVGAGVTMSIRAQSGVTRDADSKAGVAAAEAGVSQALLRYNRIPATEPAPCLVESGEPPQIFVAATGADGWCAPVSGSGGDGTAYTYHVRPTGGELEIVAIGSADGVTRRVSVLARSASGQSPFGEAAVIGLDGIGLGSNADINADVATNGNVTLASNASVCGDYLQVSEGNGVIGGATCVEPTTGTVSMPVVNQGDVATNNSNSNLSDGTDPWSGKAQHIDGAWNATTRELILGSNTAVTLTGANYSFCRLELGNNSALYIAAGASVSIYFDSPENCGYAGEAEPIVQMDLASNSRITVNEGDPSQVGLLFVGSGTLSTQINLSSNTEADQSCEQDFVVYAPRTLVEFASNSYYCGAIAGKRITLASNSHITASSQAENFEVPATASHYVTENFVECTSAATSPPDAGC